MTSKKVDQFVHLHTHTHFSILDGHDTIDELVNEVSRLGQPAVAVTDHGSLSGLYDLYNAAKKAEITPIAGCEFYMTPSIGNRLSREPLYLGEGGRDDVSGRGAYTHITILAENNIGLKNLFQLSLKASSEGFYQKPRVDLELLEEHREGLIVTTGCPSGEVQTWLRLGHPDKALEYAAKLQTIFGKENVFMELMEHGMSHELERGVRAGLLEIAAKLDMPLLATNDLHYATAADQKSHEQMLAIQTRSVMSEPPDYEGGRRFAFEGGSYYVKSAAEMASLFPDHPEALKNTLLIAERSSFEVEPDETLRPQLPGIPEGETEASWLRKEAYAGLAKRLPEKVNDPVYIDRLNMELEVLEMKGFSGYFLVVSDFVKWGKFVADPPVPTGYGRGCLSGDANILTPDGFKKISDIKVGDIVFDELGNQVEVPNVFEYDCDEPLVEIKGYYGNQGNKMTADHKVLISRANKETSPTKLSSGIKYKLEINPTEWVRADEVELGDLVVMPKLKFGNLTQGFHFNPESTVTENTPLKFSVRSIARNLNVARSTVMKFIANNGEVKGLASQKIANYFVQENITIEQMKAQQTVTTVLEKNYVEANYDLGFVFGLFISDGWIRKDSKTVIGFAQNRGEDEGTIPTVIEKVFGISPHVTDHKTKNLRQFIYRHKGIYELFANLFKEYNYTAQSKYIPKELMNTSEEFRKGLLEGLWYGDGTHKGKSKYSTVSQPLAEGVYTLLLSLGLPASIMETHRIETRPEYNKAQRESWTEYSILTAHNFDTTKMNKAKGYDGNFTYYRVREINTVQPEGKVYDFTVPTTNSYVTDSYVVHNSAAGSLVAFVMDITDADPIRFDLLFERFINPERDSPPDIDMDFNDTDRERVVEYVKEKYGLEYVAHVATFGKIGAKTAIKDVVRILERPYAQGDALSKALPPAVFGKEIKLSEVYNPQADRYHEAGEFRELVEKEKLQDVIESALKLEGRTRSIGVHAAALVISSQPVVETIPMFMRQNDGAFITQWDYPTAEALGLLKVDFLGLRNLGVIANTIQHIKATRGQDVDLQEIIQGPMDDKATYQLLQQGDTLGVFQLDGCLAGDTLVSGRKIKDLYKNYIDGKGITSTYSIDLSTGERRRNGIVRFVESGIKMVYRLVSESGRMIEATADHKFMTDSGWKRLGDIDVLVDRVLVDHTVKTLMYRECLDCGTKINSGQRNSNKRCYKCSAKFHSNPSKKASREAIAAARIKFYENGGEPWNKGLNKDTNPILAEVSRKVRAKLNGRNLNKERLSESEYLDYISEMSERMSGKNNPMYGKTTRISKRGYREDLGHYVRSSWEADYARVLNFLEEPYKYEPDTFELTRVDGSTMTYTPDFYLVNEDRYVEIKGFMRDIDAEKIKLVQEQHGIKVDVIAQSEFAELELEYKDLVAWECPEIPKSTNWENIISITQIGKQMTYDITMEAPLNNFLANGFMVHNSGMRKLLKQLKPTEFEDISAVLSLYRPGPMGVDAHTDYALRKNGLQAVTPIHPEFKESLADILGPTYNLVVYQEQVQRIAQRIAGYSLAQADLLRRAMGKKKRYIIDAEFVPFSEGAKNNGYSDEAIKALWEILVPFADYAFNKSHTVGYGLISYVTAYLKANYPAEFMSALLSSVADDTDKTALYLNECKHMGITVYPPAVSRSIEDYSPVSETEIYFGLKAIRGMGAATAEEIVKARGGKPFTSFSDFMHRMPDNLVNKRVLEGLAHGGGFDDFGIPRKSLIAAFPDMLKAVQKARKKANTGMMSLFDDDEDDMLIFNIMDIGEYSKLEKLKLERHALGLYVSDHPLNGLKIDSQSDATVHDLTSESIPPAEGGWGRPQKFIKISGIVTSLSKKRTKAGASFAVGVIEDMTGGINFAMFSKVFEQYGSELVLDGVYQFTGQHRKREGEDEIQFIVDSLRPLDFGEHGHLNVKVRLTARQWVDGRDKFLKRLERHQVDEGSLIQMSVLDGKDIHDFTLDGVTVKRSPALIADIRELFGIDSIGRWRSVEQSED